MSTRPKIKRRPIGRDRIWTSRILSFAVCSQEGRPIYVGSSFAKCLGWYVLLKGRILLDDGPAVAVEFDRLMQDGYTIRKILVKAFTSDDDIIRSYQDGITHEKAQQAFWQKEERETGKAKASSGETAHTKGRAPAAKRTRKASSAKGSGDI